MKCPLLWTASTPPPAEYSLSVWLRWPRCPQRALPYLGDADLKLCKIPQWNAQTSVAWTMFPIPARFLIPVTVLFIGGYLLLPSFSQPRAYGNIPLHVWYLSKAQLRFQELRVGSCFLWFTRTHPLYFLLSLLSNVMFMLALDSGLVHLQVPWGLVLSLCFLTSRHPSMMVKCI